MAEFVDEKLKELQARMEELAPLAAEFHRLEIVVAAATKALGSAPPPTPSPTRTPAKRTRTRKPAARRTTKPAAARRTAKRAPKRVAAPGTRATQALELITATPGITVPELAKAMRVQPNSLYRILPGLAEQGKIAKAGSGWRPADATVGSMRDGELAGVS